MIVAVMTGMTMIEVSESSQTVPPSRTRLPTTSHDIRPRSRSHWGTAKIRDSCSGSISTNVASPPADASAFACRLRS